MVTGSPGRKGTVMRHRKALAATLLTAVLAGAGGGAALAAVTTSPAAQVTDPDVYACVNPAGGIDYLEFRLPLPHRCWFAKAVVAVVGEPGTGPGRDRPRRLTMAALSTGTYGQDPAVVAAGDLAELWTWLRDMDVSGMTAGELIAKIREAFPPSPDAPSDEDRIREAMAQAQDHPGHVITR